MYKSNEGQKQHIVAPEAENAVFPSYCSAYSLGQESIYVKLI